MRGRLWWVSLLAPLPLAAQVAALTTGGGLGQVGQSTTGTIGTLGFDAAGRVGPLALDLTSATVSYQDLGTSSRATAMARWSFQRSGWRAAIGPAFEFGNAIRTDWTDAWSGTGSVSRSLGPVDLEIAVGEGVTHPRGQRVSFGRRGAHLGLQLGPVTLGGRFDNTVLRDSTLRDDVYLGGTGTSGDELFRDRVRSVSDVALVLQLDLPTVLLAGTLGRRRGDDIPTQTWWRIRAVIPLTAIASIEVGTNRNPADVVLGLPGGRQTTLGLRVALPDQVFRPRPTVRAVVERQDARHVRVILTLPGASRVRLMGEFTGWRPIELEPLGGGKYAATFFAPNGTYRINVALDDGPWVAPPGMPRVEDGFGGLVGLLEL